MKVRKKSTIFFIIVFIAQISLGSDEVMADIWPSEVASSIGFGETHLGRSSQSLLMVSARSAVSPALSLALRYYEALNERGSPDRDSLARSATLSFVYRLDVFRVIPYGELGAGGRWRVSGGAGGVEVTGGFGLAYMLEQDWSLDLNLRSSLLGAQEGEGRFAYTYLFSLERCFSFGDAFDE